MEIIRQWTDKVRQWLLKGSCILVQTAAMSGCINDDLSDCPVVTVPVNFCFTYTLNEQATDCFSREVHHVDLYFYDASGSLKAMKRVKTDTLANGNSTQLILEEGDYTAVIWGNADDGSQYECRAAQQMDEMRLDAMASTSGGMRSDADSLFHGLSRLQVREDDTRTRYIDLIRNTHDIRVLLQVENSSTPVGVNDYIIDIRGGNGSYGYDNSAKGVQLQSVSRYAMAGVDSLMAQTRTLRITQGDDMRIVIKDRVIPQKVRFDRSLSEDLLQDPRIVLPQDLDKIHRYLLVYKLTYNPDETADIEVVTVGDWDGVRLDKPLW